jgi:signal transduction histidine kinase/CHASE3 domain sensor protein
MRSGLITRLVVGGAIVAVIFLAQLWFSFDSLRAIRHDTREEQRASQSIVAATRIEKLVLDLETSTRGYVVTRQESFLQPYLNARRELPRQSQALRRLVDDPSTRTLDRQWRSYLSGWAAPLVERARRSQSAGRAMVASGGGRRQVGAIRRNVDAFVSRQEGVAQHDRRRIEAAERNGLRIAGFGALFRVLLFIAVIAYLLRAVITPIRRISGATAAVAGGKLGVEVEERGTGEVGDLAASFNEMSRSLARSRATLEEQNIRLEQLANVLRAVLDSTVDGILLSDAEGNIQLANRPVVNLTRDLGMSFEGTTVDRLLSVAHRIRDPEKYREAMERLRTNPDEPTFDEFEDAVSGRVFQGFTSPVRDDRGGFVGRIWTLREVTQQRELDRLKDDFVATVSHELRTPLTSMMGFLEMIREEEAGHLTDEQKRFLAIVYRSSERLQRLVGDLLFVARLDANGLQLRFADVDISELVGETVESSSALARSREIDLEAKLAEVPLVLGDRERLQQLVSNLISNAIKFTPAGGTVSARTFVEGGDAVIEIEDTGIGIPLAEQERLFQRFFRSSTATEQAIPGTGLGLVISKAIAEAHGGGIGVRSEAGEGTCFRVRLPLEPEEVAA